MGSEERHWPGFEVGQVWEQAGWATGQLLWLVVEVGERAGLRRVLFYDLEDGTRFELSERNTYLLKMLQKIG